MWRGPIDGERQRGRPGFSLLETLVSVTLLSLVIGGVYLMYTTMQDTMNRAELKTDLQQNARVGFDRMAREIRMAGYDPENALSTVTILPRGRLRSAMSGCLSFIAYDTDHSTGEQKSVQITYDLGETTLRRKEQPWSAANAAFNAGGGAQPLVNSVDLLTFVYYDPSNALLAPTTLSTNACPPGPTPLTQAAGQLTYWQMRQVRRIKVTLRTRGAGPGLPPESYTLTADVRLRNQ
jgi:type II secretory pathway component PulJ